MVGDGHHEGVVETIVHARFQPVRYFETPQPCNDWAAGPRTLGQRKARGRTLLDFDDDGLLLPGGLGDCPQGD